MLSSVTVVFILESRMEFFSSTSFKFKSHVTYAVRLRIFSTGLLPLLCFLPSLLCQLWLFYEVWTSMLLQPASSKNPENPFTTGGIILFLALVCRSHSTAFSQLFFLSFLSLAIFCQNHHAMLLPASSMQQCRKHTRSAQLPDGGMERLSLKIKLLKYLPF